MAITQDQLTATQQAEADAYTEWQAAEGKLKQLNDDVDKFGPQSPEALAAKSEAIAANKKYQAARQTNKDTKAAYQKENPTAKAPTPGATAKDKNEVSIQDQIARNGQETGFYETDVARKAREDKDAAKGQPKPPTTPNAVQKQNADTNTANSAETAVRDQNTAADAAARNQITAQNDAITAANNRRNQIGQEGVEGAKLQNQNIDQVKGAATTLITQQQTERQQEIDIMKSRQSFFTDVESGVMSGIVSLLKMGKGGSKAAIAFAAAYLAMANSNYHTAGLDQEPAKVNQDSPEMQALRKIAGYTLPDKQPTVPTTDQLDWATMISMARSGNPPPGWHGPIGAAAMQIPATPENIAKYTGADPATADQKAKDEQIRQVKSAMDTAEGRALVQAMPPEIQAIVAKTTKTPEEQQKLDQYRADTNAKLQQIYQQHNPGSAPASSTATVPAVAASEVAQPGDPNYGKPLAPTPPAGTTIDPDTGLPMTQEQADAAKKARAKNALNPPNFNGGERTGLENTFEAPNPTDSSSQMPRLPLGSQGSSNSPDVYDGNPIQFSNSDDVPDYSGMSVPDPSTLPSSQSGKQAPDTYDGVPDFSSALFTPQSTEDDNPYNFTFNS